MSPIHKIKMSNTNFYFEEIAEHPLKGKVCDFDWRSPKDKGTPYDDKTFTVEQGLRVEWVGKNCHGDVFAFFKNRAHCKIDKVCKIH